MNAVLNTLLRRAHRPWVYEHLQTISTKLQLNDNPNRAHTTPVHRPPYPQPSTPLSGDLP
jgi:hypothetical protein